MPQEFLNSSDKDTGRFAFWPLSYVQHEHAKARISHTGNGTGDRSDSESSQRSKEFGEDRHCGRRLAERQQTGSRTEKLRNDLGCSFEEMALQLPKHKARFVRLVVACYPQPTRHPLLQVQVNRRPAPLQCDWAQRADEAVRRATTRRRSTESL